MSWQTRVKFCDACQPPTGWVVVVRGAEVLPSLGLNLESMIWKSTSGFACYSLGRSKEIFGILEWDIVQSAPSNQYRRMEIPVKKNGLWSVLGSKVCSVSSHLWEDLWGCTGLSWELGACGYTSLWLVRQPAMGPGKPQIPQSS